jgi:uncharacterized protein (DUF2236 family)
VNEVKALGLFFTGCFLFIAGGGILILCDIMESSSNTKSGGLMRKPNGVILKPIETVVFNGQLRPKTFLKVSAYDEDLKAEIVQHVRLIPFLLRIRLRLAIRACYVISRKLRKVAKHVPISFA